MQKYFFSLLLCAVAFAAVVFTACQKEEQFVVIPETSQESLFDQAQPPTNGNHNTHDSTLTDRSVVYQLPVSGTGWYHAGGSGGHYPSAGYESADDSYAFDLNLSNNADKGKPVYSIADNGLVKQVNTNWGWVLIEYPYSVTWKGVSYNKFYVGYLHMTNISVSQGSTVNKGTQIGKIGKVQASTEHLHFTCYVGDLISGSNPNSKLLSFNPSVLGSPFGNFNYGTKIYDNFVDDQSNNSFAQFVKSNTSGWSESWSYGMFSHMFYTAGSSANQEIGIWGFLEGSQTTASNWRFYVFVPNNYATATAALYKVYQGANNTYLGSFTINQSSYYNKWVQSTNFSLTNGQNTKVALGDGGNAGKIVGYDMVRRFRKVDGNITIN